MKAKKIMRIAILVVCFVMLLVVSAFAYQADLVQDNDYFPDGKNVRGRLFINSLGDYAPYYEYLGSADTGISGAITFYYKELYVQYWLTEYNPQMQRDENINIVSVDWSDGYNSTMTGNTNVVAYKPTRMDANHRVIYNDGNNEYIWTASTSAIDDFRLGGT